MKKLVLLAALIVATALPLTAQQLVLDPTFGTNGYSRGPLPNNGAGGVVTDMVVTPSGKFILGGTHSTQGQINELIALVQFNADGTLDTASFGNNGVVAHSFTFRNSCKGLAVQPDGKILVAGNENGSNAGSTIIPCLSRYNSDGTVDYAFGDSGRVALRFDPVSSGTFFKPFVVTGGKILAVGMSNGNINGGTTGYGIMRFNSDGTLDPTFGNNGKVVVPAGVQSSMYALMQPDGKIVIAGENRPYPDPPRFGAARFFQNGVIDSTFGTNGIFLVPFSHNYTGFGSLMLQPDGKVLITGTRSNPIAFYEFHTLRLTANGVIDTSFGTNGFVNVNFNSYVACHDGLVYPNGNILLAGRYPPNNEDAGFAQLTSTGVLDSSFGYGNGTFTHPIDSVNNRSHARRVLLDSNGRLIVGGLTDNGSSFIIARFDHVFTGLQDSPDNGIMMNLYPNPTSGILNVSLTLPSALSVKLRIIDLQGREVFSKDQGLQSSSWRTISLDVSALSSGTYLLLAETPEGTATRLFMR